MKLRRLAAALLLAAIGFALGQRFGQVPAASPPDYSAYDRAQLSWAAEGIMERISELEDQLTQVRAILSGS